MVEFNFPPPNDNGLRKYPQNKPILGRMSPTFSMMYPYQHKENDVCAHSSGI